MNHWQYEQSKGIDECSRQSIRSEGSAENFVRPLQVYRPGISMQVRPSRANGLIAKGHRLCQRDESPTPCVPDQARTLISSPAPCLLTLTLWQGVY